MSPNELMPNELILPRLIFTRPLAQSLALQAIWEYWDVPPTKTPTIFPLFEIGDVDKARQIHNHQRIQVWKPSFLHHPQCWIFVSVNAVHYFFQSDEVQSWLHHLAQFSLATQRKLVLQCAAVGEATRRALIAELNKQGLHFLSASIITAPRDKQDAQGLWQVLQTHLSNQRVILIRGENSHPFLAQQLQKTSHISFEEFIVYSNAPVVMNESRQQSLQQLFNEPNEWYITSSAALRYLHEAYLALSQAHPVPQAVALMRQQKLWLTHPRMQETAEHLGFACYFLIPTYEDDVLNGSQNVWQSQALRKKMTKSDLNDDEKRLLAIKYAPM